MSNREIDSEEMTLRDYFAAKALQAIAIETLKDSQGNLHLLAKNAYHIANAMMEARK
jgi:hypothetical protein